MALADLDSVVKAVRAATDGPAASRDLQAGFGLTQEQVLGAYLASDLTCTFSGSCSVQAALSLCSGVTWELHGE